VQNLEVLRNATSERVPHHYVFSKTKRKKFQPFPLIILAEDQNGWKLNSSSGLKLHVRCFGTGTRVSDKWWINTCQICCYLMLDWLTLAIYQCIKETWFDPTGGKAELCVYCLEASVTLGKLAAFHNPRGGKAMKGKQISLKGGCVVVVNPLLKVAPFVSSAVPYSEIWSLYNSFRMCSGNGSKTEFQ